MQDLDNKEEWRSLENTVWKTRTARIHSEKRCINLATFYQTINLYYTCIVIILSMLNYANFIDVYIKEKLTLLSLIMSVCLMLVILRLNPEHYRELANKYKSNHIALQDLWYEVVDASQTGNILEYQKKYTSILSLCPNHTEQDYREGIYDNRYNDEITWQRCTSAYYINLVRTKILQILWILLPVFVIVIVCVV